VVLVGQLDLVVPVIPVDQMDLYLLKHQVDLVHQDLLFHPFLQLILYRLWDLENRGIQHLLKVLVVLYKEDKRVEIIISNTSNGYAMAAF